MNLYTYKDETIKEVPTKELYNELAVVEFESGKNGILTFVCKQKKALPLQNYLQFQTEVSVC